MATMARLDPVIDRLFSEGASALVFETGGSGALLTPSGSRSLYRQPLSSQQILGAFAEIVPLELRSSLGTDGNFAFPYATAAGTVKVTLALAAGRVTATVEPQQEHAPQRQAPAWPQQPPSSPPQAAPQRQVAERDTVAPVLQEGSIQLSADPREAMEQLLSLMGTHRASDLHLGSGHIPVLRVDGDMVPFDKCAPIPASRLEEMLWAIAPERNRAEWEECKDTDFAHENDQARFRVNVFADRQGIGAVLRTIPNKIMTAEEMKLSQPILDLCSLTKGLVLVTGPTGSGKSTTLAAMIDYVNRNRADHIITIEDPIEFLHPHKRCLVNQREIHTHTTSFKQALRAALREDPDVILVGELRDLETVAIAIETAETGHLVFGTLHTNTAAATIDRIIDQFPTDRQEQIRMMLSESLKGVISQTLCKKIGGGRAAAQEVLICNNAITNLIREGKTFQIPSIMQTQRNAGMVTLNDALFDLVQRGLVAPIDAFKKAVARNEFKNLLERSGFSLEEPAAS